MSAPTAVSYRVEAHVVRPGVSAATSKKAVVEFDTSPQQGAELPGPADLLAMAFAACILKNVERFSSILPFRYATASVTVDAERQEAPPKMTRIRYVLRLATDEPERRIELLHRNIREHGTIYNTLAAVCDVSGDLEVTTPSPASART